MSRINYSDDEDFPGQFNIWQANCRRSLQGKKGQQELRELEAALLALPEKRLIHGELQDENGAVCAIAAYGKHKGVDLSKFDNEYESDEVGIAGGMPRLVAWKVVALNDIEIGEWDWVKCEGPNQLQYPDYPHYYQAGYDMRVPVTPESRYEQVLAWVRRELHQDGPAVRRTTS